MDPLVDEDGIEPTLLFGFLEKALTNPEDQPFPSFRTMRRVEVLRDPVLGILGNDD